MPKKKYTGRLAEPLGPPPAVLGTDNYKEASESYQREIDHRFRLLMDHYEIDPTAPSAIQLLAIRLAQEHVPGLRPWKRSVDTDRHVRIMLRMLFLVRVRGLPEKSAAEALSKVVPDLGDAEAIRSIYREQRSRPNWKKLPELFRKIEETLGPKVFEKTLADAIGPEVELLRQVKKPRRGRPPKK